ncbi:MAG: adenylate kinase, partial [Lachnospiraceae bacterium]|nr:adenylate kinase [Lachnospiraceae bacterium]
QPLIDYYRAEGVLKSVDGTQAMDKVFEDIKAVL